MTGALGAGGNLTLGVVYFVIGSLVAVDLGNDMSRRGWSHFGVAWVSIMYTCGLHHFVHGTHLGLEGRNIGAIDVLAVAMGLPVGIAWSALRIEASRGGRGDRFIAGTPRWLRATAGGYAVATVVVFAGVVALADRAVRLDPRLLPNVLIVVLYSGIGALLLRGQLRNHTERHGWSLGGLSLMMIFPTSAVMHGVYVVFAATGSFAPDWHGLWADWLSVPAALYFFWVVAGLERGTLRDWNKRFEAIDDLAPERDDLAPA